MTSPLHVFVLSLNFSDGDESSQRKRRGRERDDVLRAGRSVQMKTISLRNTSFNALPLQG